MMTDEQITGVGCLAFMLGLFGFMPENIGIGWLAGLAMVGLVLATDYIAVNSKHWPAIPDGVAGQPSFHVE